MMTKQLELCKKNKMNICRICEAKYFVTANKEGECEGGKAHEPGWDFSLSDNVLECAIAELA